jgi:hypothetical protein
MHGHKYAELMVVADVMHGFEIELLHRGFMGAARSKGVCYRHGRRLACVRSLWDGSGVKCWVARMELPQDREQNLALSHLTWLSLPRLNGRLQVTQVLDSVRMGFVIIARSG